MTGAFIVRPPELRDPEVEYLDPPLVGDEQVVGLHVAVDDALVVRRGKPLRSLTRVLDRLARRQRPSAHSTAERFPFEQFGDDERRSGFGADIVNGQDVRVIELSGGARLLLEATQPAGVRRERVGDQLDRDLAPEPWIAGAVHLAHATRTQPADDLIGADARSRRKCHGTGES